MGSLVAVVEIGNVLHIIFHADQSPPPALFVPMNLPTGLTATHPLLVLTEMSDWRFLGVCLGSQNKTMWLIGHTRHTSYTYDVQVLGQMVIRFKPIKLQHLLMWGIWLFGACNIFILFKLLTILMSGGVIRRSCACGIFEGQPLICPPGCSCWEPFSASASACSLCSVKLEETETTSNCISCNAWNLDLNETPLYAAGRHFTSFYL